MTICNNTGVLRKVMLCPPDFYEIVPVSDFSRTALERGDKVDHVKAQAQHDELAGCLRDAGIDVYYIEEPDPTRHWAVYARDFAVNSPEGVVICRFKFAERKGEEIPGEKQLRKLGQTILDRVERGAWEGEMCAISMRRTWLPDRVNAAPGRVFIMPEIYWLARGSRCTASRPPPNGLISTVCLPH